MDIKKEKEEVNIKNNKMDIEEKEKEYPRNEENKDKVLKEINNYQYSNNGVNYII
jgi:hypothetical protein